LKDNKLIYFPGLNGLRAIAAIAVVISHITISLKQFNLNPYIFGALKDGSPRGLTLAEFGVSIFFVLSGFLITYLLQAEKKIRQIDIPKFYIRRILRIWPLYYFYLPIAIAVLIAFKLIPDFKMLLFYIFFAADIPSILKRQIVLVGHYWSLGVEEQFYLFWPWVNKKINSLVPFLVVVIILLIILKLTFHFLYPGTIKDNIFQVARFHCMMIGALGAVLYKKENPLFLVVTDNKIIQFISWTIIFLAAFNKFHIWSIIDNEIISVVALFIIIGQVRIKNRIINLEVPVMDFLGKISYSIYVIHPLIIFFFAKTMKLQVIATPFQYIIIYFVIISSTIFLSFLSYTYIEKYFLRYKKRFEIVKSSGSRPRLFGALPSVLY